MPKPFILVNTIDCFTGAIMQDTSFFDVVTQKDNIDSIFRSLVDTTLSALVTAAGLNYFLVPHTNQLLPLYPSLTYTIAAVMTFIGFLLAAANVYSHTIGFRQCNPLAYRLYQIATCFVHTTIFYHVVRYFISEAI